MTMKSLFLGAAAGIAAIGAAQAADLPMTKGEAVEYVKVCSTFGPGFFYIPGTDTCLKIGGEARAYYRFYAGDSLAKKPSGLPAGGQKFSRNDNRSAFGTEGRIWFDARTQTDYGLLRSYFQINAVSRKANRDGLGATQSFSIDKAFIQFGGLTAGYAHSVFGIYDKDYGDTIYAPYYASSHTVNLLAYTAQFGGGFSATLSLEDGRDHRQDVIKAQGGQQIPDIVGIFRYDADWGSLAASAAGHQFRSALFEPDGKTPIAPRINQYGYAVGGTLLIKVPGVDKGHFVVEGQYADGALDYLGAGASLIGGSQDAYNVRNVGKSGKGWSLSAELGGNITPVLGANLVASYIDISLEGVGVAKKTAEYREYTIAGNLTYLIVKGLKLSGEIAYTHAEAENVGKVAKPLTDTVGAWQVGTRLLRNF